MGLFGFLVNQEIHSLTLVFLDSNVSNWILHYPINEVVYRLYISIYICICICKRYSKSGGGNCRSSALLNCQEDTKNHLGCKNQRVGKWG